MKKDVGIGFGSFGFMQQTHARFLGRIASFAVIARYTSTSDIFPDMWAASVSGQNMVNSEILCFASAVLTSKTIPEKHFLPAKSMLLNRTFYHIDQPDNCRNIKRGMSSMNFASSILQHLCFTTTHKAYRPTDVANVESLVILV